MECVGCMTDLKSYPLPYWFVLSRFITRKKKQRICFSYRSVFVIRGRALDSKGQCLQNGVDCVRCTSQATIIFLRRELKSSVFNCTLLDIEDSDGRRF